MISRRMNWLLLVLVLFVATFFAASSVLMVAVQVVLGAALAWLGYTRDRAPTAPTAPRRSPPAPAGCRTR